VKQSGKSFNPV